MLNEPTTIASVARLVGETLREDYGADPAPLYRELGIDTAEFFRPGSRIAFSTMDCLWQRAAAISGDPEFGVNVGLRVRPNDFFVLGHAWLASDTLCDALRRLSRFVNVLSTIGSHMHLRQDRDTWVLIETGARRRAMPQQVAMDAGYVALLRLIDFVTIARVRPLHVNLRQAMDASVVDYQSLLGCPVSFGMGAETWTFASRDIEAPLSGAAPEVADAADRIASKYLASVDEGTVAREVRQVLIRTLPSGSVDLATIAQKLHRSRSTLQRQLSSEGTSYREILESTRQALAEKYLRDGNHSQAQVAFIVGFTDQSNFSRAFKRWTGKSPGEFQKVA